jgi:DNA (cytosine-5)-methyltransferase 1
VSKDTLRRWDKSGKLVPLRHPINDYRVYKLSDLKIFNQSGFIFDDDKNIEETVKSLRKYKTIELFAGAGGLALGLEKAGLECVLLNEIDKDACATLKQNRPNWNVVHEDVSKIDFTKHLGNIDLVTGGFPCHAFSYAGNRLGFNDARGTLFYEFARAVKETQPLMAVGENVRGLLNHEGGKTLSGMISILNEIGYEVIPPQVLKAIYFNVPQKRERLFLVAIRKDLNAKFEYPKQNSNILTLKDALKKGVLYETDVPNSPGQKYPNHKKLVMDLVPPGGYWRDLPIDIQRRISV